ncbi:hypothetical protein ATOBIA_N05760 [Atopobiaceae bacterium P1]|nr:hypothetical protein ATOBIA_N05760 [Atopobiaceae bacterium P1]
MGTTRYSNGSRRRSVRKRLASMGLPCAICGDPIDYSLPPGLWGSFEVDEVTPYSLGGSELDMDNLQPAHRLCNELKGNKLHFHLNGFREALALRAKSSRAMPGASPHQWQGPMFADESARWS